jgi:hypothetical protein
LPWAPIPSSRTPPGPYNRRLFLRAAHGYYVLNPALEIEVKGEWIDVADLMRLPLLLESMGPRLDYLRSWMTRMRDEVAREVDAEAAAPAGDSSRSRSGTDSAA